MKLLKILLLPFALLYGTGAWFRNLLFDLHILKQTAFNHPVIVVGNLNTGGTGKTPHVNYLTDLLKAEMKVAIVSRGYKRKTKGFILADSNSMASEIGDEPLQYTKRFPGITVAVCEKRAGGISAIIEKKPDTEVFILDDAFQHRYVKPGLSILLTGYGSLYANDFPLPYGRLREFACGSERADIIVVTKSPGSISEKEREYTRGKLNPTRRQSLFFSHLIYGKIKAVPGSAFSRTDEMFDSVLLLTGIADPLPLKKRLEGSCNHMEHMSFNDHHSYTTGDLDRIREAFIALPGNDKAIITTEKDAMRLIEPSLSGQVAGLPLAYLPVEVRFNDDDEKKFNKIISDYVRKNQ